MMQKLHSNLPDINFSHLRTFLALAQVANFSETGRRLGLSQSAISRHIRGLEEMLGVRLFERLGRRAVLTSAGRALRTRLQTLMREAESLPRVIRDLAQGVRGDLRIGASVTAANAIVPPVLGAYRRQYPDVELALQPSNSARLLETLGSGEIDLAFVGCEALPLGVGVLAEIPDELVLIASRAHPFAGRRIKQEDLRGCDFILRDAGSDTRAVVTQWFQAEGVQPRTLMEVGWPEITKRLVGAGIWISAMSHRLMRDELSRGTLKLVKIAGWPLRRKIRIVQLREAFALKAVQHFLQLARHKIPEIRALEAADAALPR